MQSWFSSIALVVSRPRAYNSRRCNAGDVSDEKLDVATLQRAFAGQS
jgi:hypothetical protein